LLQSDISACSVISNIYLDTQHQPYEVASMLS